MAFWGPILGSVIGVLGGSMIARQQQKAAESAEKRNQQYLEESKLTDLSKLRESAEKAGFNPLTALRSGAGNFQSNTAIMPSMSGYQFAVEAMSQGVNSAVSYAETYKERALDTLLKTYQFKGMQADIALTKAQTKNLGIKKKDDTAYLFNDDGSPMKNIFGQHMYVDPNAAAVFPTLQGYITADGETLSLPHEQLLDMGATSLPTAVAAIETGRVAAKSNVPTIFKYPHQAATGQRFTYGDLSNGQFINWRN